MKLARLFDLDFENNVDFDQIWNAGEKVVEGLIDKIQPLDSSKEEFNIWFPSRFKVKEK